MGKLDNEQDALDDLTDVLTGEAGENDDTLAEEFLRDYEAKQAEEDGGDDDS